MKTKLRTCVGSLMVFMMLGTAAWAGALAPARIFSDGVVLQADKPIPVWGTAVPGAKIRVKFADRQYQTVADTKGSWTLTMAPLPASAEGRTLWFASDDGSSLEVKDVLVGEVWICSGQSNMAWRMQNLRGKKGQPADNPVMVRVREELANANDPLLRQFEVDGPPSPFKEASEIHSKKGWVGVDANSLLRFSAVAYFFGSELRKELHVPVGLILSAKGGTKVEAWLPQEGITRVEGGSEYYAEELSALKERIQEWEAIPAVNAAGKPKNGPGPIGNGNVPTTLFNGMVAPLVPYAVRGGIWYQGEANARFRSAHYLDGFTTLVNTWRARWGQEDLYFFWCQLANFTHADFPDWIEVSWQQRQALDQLEQGGMAVLNDIGMSDNIHPRNKIDAGKRLSLHALNQAYGRDLVASGPLFSEARVDMGRMMVHFNACGSGLMTGRKEELNAVTPIKAPLGGFEIQGADGVWHDARAMITGADTVMVWHDQVPDPTGVRYAWASHPEQANLYNKEGLPSSLFMWEVPPTP